MDLNYYDTLIAVADDCPVSSAVVPAARGGKKTVAVVQYELIAADPGGLTQEDVLFESWLIRNDRPSSERARLRAQFFAKPQACLRASPLPKKYGWGLLCDEAGRVRLCPMESRSMSGSPPETCRR
ncbi:DUF6157 family protein [Nonomuraea sp. H19]|uniref:DUF6157 family protein n=1 Tax=Nonomuraea sp. H19 TaxID=3452206 RepID=UPI003F8A379A